MAKKRVAKKRQQEKRRTNWLVIGSVIVVGVIGLFSLLYLEVNRSETQTAQTLSEYCQENNENCVTMGATDAPVTFVEVSDFGCPHCRSFHQEKATVIKEQYVDSGQVKWVFLPYALSPETEPAANAALCADEQDKYYEFTEALFSQNPETTLTRNGFFLAAEEADIQIDPFTICLEENRYSGIIKENQQAARSVRVTGTPTFFVNDQIIRGNAPMSEFEDLFNQAAGS